MVYILVTVWLAIVRTISFQELPRLCDAMGYNVSISLGTCWTERIVCRMAEAWETTVSKSRDKGPFYTWNLPINPLSEKKNTSRTQAEWHIVPRLATFPDVLRHPIRGSLNCDCLHVAESKVCWWSLLHWACLRLEFLCKKDSHPKFLACLVIRICQNNGALQGTQANTENALQGIKGDTLVNSDESYELNLRGPKLTYIHWDTRTAGDPCEPSLWNSQTRALWTQSNAETRKWTQKSKNEGKIAQTQERKKSAKGRKRP